MKKIFLFLLGVLATTSAFAVTPADPTNVTWYDCGDESGNSYLTFTLPTVDVNGNPLDIEMMGYRIFTDDDQPFTFNSSIYSGVWGSTTELYFYNWEAGSDIQSNGVYFYRTNADGYERFFNERIGIQVFYLNDNFSIGDASNIVYTYLDNPVAELPKPATPKISEFIDYGSPVGFYLGYDIPQTFMTQEPVADDYTIDKEFNDIEDDFTILDQDKVSFSIITDNDQVFTFTPEMFPQIDEPYTQFPFTSRTTNGNVGYSGIHFNGLTNQSDEPVFTWRIGIQTYYTDNGQTRASDIYYMEVYPQLQEAQEITSTSFLADWSCEAENTYTLSGFKSYELHVIDKATGEEVLVQEVEPTNPQTEINEYGQEVVVDYPIPGATFTVEGLTPGNTYQFYVVCSDHHNSFNSVTREVTLPGDDHGYDLGDVNHDHSVSISDVTALIDYLLGGGDICTICADVNGDKTVTISDVTALIDKLLGGN